MAERDHSIDGLEREFVDRIGEHDASSAARFGVTIDGAEVDGWQLVDLPEVSTEEGRAGDSNHTPLEMERGVSPGDDRHVWNWVDDIRNGRVEDGRRDIVISLEDAAGNPLTRWEFTECWPKNYDPPDLDASADGEVATERLTVLASGYANREVERICGHDLDQITQVYSQSTSDLPGTLRGLVTDAVIHGSVAGDDDEDYTIRTGPDGEVEAVIDRKPSDPDLVVETDCETLTEIVTADDPQAPVQTAYEDGDIRVRGTGLVSGILTGIARTVTGIVDALD